MSRTSYKNETDDEVAATGQDSTQKQEPSTSKRDRLRLKRSGMREGALLKYTIKQVKQEGSPDVKILHDSRGHQKLASNQKKESGFATPTVSQNRIEPTSRPILEEETSSDNIFLPDSNEKLNKCKRSLNFAPEKNLSSIPSVSTDTHLVLSPHLENHPINDDNIETQSMEEDNSEVPRKKVKLVDTRKPNQEKENSGESSGNTEISTTPPVVSIEPQVEIANTHRRLANTSRNNVRKNKFLTWTKDRLTQIIQELDSASSGSPLPDLGKVVQIICDCILRVNTRVNKDVQKIAVVYFQQLSFKILQSCSRQKGRKFSEYRTFITGVINYIWDLFEQLTAELQRRQSDNQCRLINFLLETMKDEKKMKLEDKIALQFFRILTHLGDEQQKQQMEFIGKNMVRTRQPVYIQLMMATASLPFSYNKNWEHCLKFLAEFSPQSEEAQILMSWVNLLIQHYQQEQTVNSHRKEHLTENEEFLSCAIVQNIKVRGDPDGGLKYISLMSKTKLSMRVCECLLKNMIEIDVDSTTNWTAVFNDMSAHMPCREESTEVSEVTVKTNGVVSDERAAFEAYVTKRTNPMGETSLHRVCGGRKIPVYNHGASAIVDAKDILKRMKIDGIGDINVLDNSGNTPLHEACYHGQTHVVNTIWELFTHRRPVGPMNVKILHQNEVGASPLHYAAENGHFKCVERLLMMAKIINKENELLGLRNRKGKTAAEIAYERKDISEATQAVWRHFENYSVPVRLHFGSIKFEKDTVCKLEGNPEFLNLLSLWRSLSHINRK